MFGDDAVNFLLSAGPKQVTTITIKFVAELNAALCIAPN